MAVVKLVVQMTVPENLRTSDLVDFVKSAIQSEIDHARKIDPNGSDGTIEDILAAIDRDGVQVWIYRIGSN